MRPFHDVESRGKLFLDWGVDSLGVVSKIDSYALRGKAEGKGTKKGVFFDQKGGIFWDGGI